MTEIDQDQQQPPTLPPPPAEAAQQRRVPTRPSQPFVCLPVLYATHGHPTPPQFPAVVQRVNADGTLNLFVFGPRGHVIAENCKQGTGVGEWDWCPELRP